MDLDTSLGLEDAYYKSGHDEGTRTGEITGLIEGRIYGSEIAFERYFALGQLLGRLDLWKAQYVDNPRLTKHIQRAFDLVEAMPKDNEETREGQDYETVLAAITGKMKVISSLCGSSENLIRQGIVPDAQLQTSNTDLEDGGELAVQLRGGQRKGCATAD